MPTPAQVADDEMTKVDAKPPVTPRSAAALAAPAAPASGVLPRETPSKAAVAPLAEVIQKSAAVPPADVRPKAAVSPPAEPSQKAPASVPAEAREDVRPLVRAMVEQSVAPLDRTVRDLLLRIEELEKRPAAAPAPAAPLAPPAAVVAARPAAIAAAPVRAFANPGGVPFARDPNVQHTGRAIDVAAIDRSVRLGPEMDAFDGRKRRRRLIIAGALACVVLFAGLFAALVESYTHTHG